MSSLELSFEQIGRFSQRFRETTREPTTTRFLFAFTMKGTTFHLHFVLFAVHQEYDFVLTNILRPRFRPEKHFSSTIFISFSSLFIFN